MTSYLYEIENHNFKEVNWQDVVGHFVYMLIDSKTNIPFYIGKGKGRRPQNHFESPIWKYFLKGKISDPHVIYILTDLDDREAYDWENAFIKAAVKCKTEIVNRTGIIPPPSAKGRKLSKEFMEKRINSRKENRIKHPEITQKENERLRKINQNLIETGKHPFLGGEVQRRTAKRLIEEGKHHLQNSEFQSNIQQKLLTEGKHHSQKEHICPYCQKAGKGTTMFRWHFDNCKRKTLR